MPSPQGIKPSLPAINWKDPLSRKLIFAMPLYEKGGNTLHDIARNLPLTSAVMTPASWQSTPWGPALTMISTGYIPINGAAFPALAQEFTFMFWVKPSTTASQYFFGNGTGANGAVQIRTEATNAVSTLITGSQTAICNGILTAGTWNQVVVRKTNATNGHTFFINGVRQTTSSNANTTYVDVTTDHVIGSRIAGTNANFTGALLDYRIWNRALTDKEIRSMWDDPWRLYRTPKPMAMSVVPTAGKTTVSITKSLTYTVKKAASALTKSLTYDIRRTPSALTKSLTYDIRRTPSAITKTLTYAIAGGPVPHSITKSLTYTIKKAQAALTKSLTYDVKIVHSALTKSLTYDIRRAPSALTKSLTYTIKKSASALTKSLTYTIAGSTPAYLPNIQAAVQIGPYIQDLYPFRYPVWNTAGRPLIAGITGYNTDLNQLEIYTGTVWKKLITGV